MGDVYQMKVKQLSIPLVLSVLVTLCSRVYQLMNPTAATNMPDIVAFSCAFLAFLVVTALVCLSKDVTSQLQIKKSSIVAATSILLTVLLVAESFVRLINYITSSREIMQLGLGVFGILSGITVAIIGISFYKGENCFKTSKYITLFPSVWAIFRLLELFFIYNAESNDPWEMIDEIAMIFLLLFFINQARAFADVENDNKIKNMFLWGISGSAFLILYTVSDLILVFSNPEIFKIGSILKISTDLVIAAFIILFLFNLGTEKLAQEVTEKPEESIEENVDDNSNNEPFPEYNIEKNEEKEMRKEPYTYASQNNESIDLVNSAVDEANETTTSTSTDVQEVLDLINEANNLANTANSSSATFTTR